MNEIQELKEKINEMEGIINYMLKQGLFLSHGGYLSLLEEVKAWKIKLAKLQAEQAKTIITQIKSN
jgi:hypothetical protein